MFKKIIRAIFGVKKPKSLASMNLTRPTPQQRPTPASPVMKIRRSTDESPTRNFLDDVAGALPSFDDIPSGRSSHSHSPSSHSHGHSSHDYGSSSHGHGHSSHDYGSSSGHSSHDYGSSYDSGSSSSSDGGSYGGSD